MRRQGIPLSQRKYVLDILYETRKLGAKPCSTPITHNVQLTKVGELFEDPDRYRRLVGKLNLLPFGRPIPPFIIIALPSLPLNLENSAKTTLTYVYTFLASNFSPSTQTFLFVFSSVSSQHYSTLSNSKAKPCLPNLIQDEKPKPLLHLSHHLVFKGI